LDTVLLKVGSPPALQAQVNFNASVRISAPTLADNLATAFIRVAVVCGDHNAAETESGAFSYDWVLRAALSVRRYLCSRSDYFAGAPVALQLANSPEYLAAFYGTLLADCVVVPLPVAMESAWRKKIYELCHPLVLMSRAQDLGGEATISPVATLSLSESLEKAIALPRLSRKDRDLAMVLFTSGSTGLPKGVMLSHRNLLANADSILHELPIRADDRTLTILPFCHAFGNSILQTHALSGATLILWAPTPFPASIVDALRNLQCTTFSAVPEVYSMLLKYGRLGDRPLEKLRYMTVAGGKLRYDLCVEVADRIAPAPFYVMYGQSEATARLAVLPPDQLRSRRGSIGKPIHGVEFRIADESNRELPPGAVGMLCARGDNVMLGYWHDPSATADVLTDDGWLRTNDLAHRDDDGYFYLHGRANLLVKIQGYRVHPAEIEALVEEAFPHVAAVAIPAARGDETRFVLFLAPRDDRPVDVKSVRSTCQQELPPYKVPVHFEVLDHLPLTSGHKVDRTVLEALGARLLMPVT